MEVCLSLLLNTLRGHKLIDRDGERMFDIRYSKRHCRRPISSRRLRSRNLSRKSTDEVRA